VGQAGRLGPTDPGPSRPGSVACGDCLKEPVVFVLSLFLTVLLNVTKVRVLMENAFFLCFFPDVHSSFIFFPQNC
jgi:hypothetical protein